MDELRKPLFFVAVGLLAIAFLFELGNELVVSTQSTGAYSQVEAPAPGVGVSYIALIDGLLLFTVGLMGASLILPERVHGRIQGIATFLVSLGVLITTISLIFVAVGLLALMVSLLTALPFGPPIYASLFGGFGVGEAAAVLSLSTTLKLAAGGCLLFAHQRFLQNKGLVLLAGTSLLANVIVGILHGIVPGLLAAVTDAISGIVVGVIAAVWAVVLLIGSIPSVLKAIA